MSNWIESNTSLCGQIVGLLPLERHHFAELEKLSRDERIWEHYAMDGTDPHVFADSLKSAIIEKENGTQFPFIIVDMEKRRIVGSTRFLDIQQEHRKLEIGWTWLHPDYWGTMINLECKLILLTYCFETLSAVRVQLKTDENNIRSRKAIEKIGGRFEGILRHEMLRDNGTKRNSAYYSIIDDEWEEVKSKLLTLITNKMSAKSS